MCQKVESCTASEEYTGSVAEANGYLDSLKTLSAVEVWSYSMLGDYANWGPIPVDGVFFTSDPRHRIYQNNVPTNVPYFITVNSYEGTLLSESMFPNGFSFEDLDASLSLFGSETGKRTEYLDAYNKASGTNIQTLSSKQNFTLGTFLFGDGLIREPAQTEAIAYANAGAPVYALYFDMDTELDILTLAETCCGVAHGSELLYTFGSPFFGLDWEANVEKYIVDQYSSIIKTGSPLSDWPQFSVDTPSQLVLRNTNTGPDVLLESIQIPLPSKRAISHWQSLVGSNAVQPALFIPLVLSLLFAL